MAEQVIIGDPLLRSPESDFEPISPKIRKFGAYMLAYTVFVTAYNGFQFGYTLGIEGRRDDIEMIEDAAKCPPFDYVNTDLATGRPIVPQGFTLEQAIATTTTENDFADVKSAADNVEPRKFNLFASINELLGFDDTEFASFTSEYSGADFHLYSDREDPFESVDTEVIDELIHASLDDTIVYDHITVNQFMEYARDNILLSHGGHMLDGERINIYLHSQPEYCWSNGTVQKFPTGTGTTFKEFCDSRGASYKDVTISIIPGILQYEHTWMAVMTHRSLDGKANEKLNEGLLHEFVHIVQQYLGLPFKYNPNERHADYVEEETIETLYPDGLPLGIKFNED